MNIFYPLETLSGLWHRIPRYTKIQFFSAIIIGLSVHMYMLTNGFVNHDSMMINAFDKRWFDVLGRWFGIVVDGVTTSYVLFWVNRFLGIIYAAIAVSIIGYCLKIKRTPLVLVFSGVAVSFPALACAFAYANTADGFFAVAALVSLAFLIARRYKYGFIFGVIPLVLGMASYQAYIGFFSGLMAAVLIMDFLINREEPKVIFIKGLKYLTTFVAGLVLYVLSTKTALVGELFSYAEVDNMGGVTLSNFFPRFINSYYDLASIFLFDSYNIHHTWMWVVYYPYLFAAAVLCIAFLVVYLIIKKQIYKNKASLILLLIMLVLFPAAVNIVMIASPAHMYIVMQYSLIIIFALVLSIISLAVEAASKTPGKWQIRCVGLSVWALLLIFCLTSITYTLYSNISYWKMEIMHKQGYAYSVALMTRIQYDVDYKGEKIIFLSGSPPANYSMQQFKKMEALRIGDSIPRMHSFSEYLYNHIGLENTIFDKNHHLYKEFPELQGPEFNELLDSMPDYPARGSIAEFRGVTDDFIVVKFSD